MSSDSNFRIHAEKWVEERELAVRTEDPYKHLLRLCIPPGFGALDLDEITAPRVREWRAERLRATEAKTTVTKAYRLLKSILETAVDDDRISRNPCRIKGAGKESAAERRIATVAQVDALAHAIGIRWRLMVYLGAYGPMRPEELAGLRRRDVDPDNMVIRVRVAEPVVFVGEKGAPFRRTSCCRPVVWARFGHGPNPAHDAPCRTVRSRIARARSQRPGGQRSSWRPLIESHSRPDKPH